MLKTPGMNRPHSRTHTNFKTPELSDSIKRGCKNSRQKERLQVTEKGMLAVVFVV